MAIDKLSGNSFATGAIANSLGYTPANKAGDTFTGAVTFSNTVTINSDYVSPYAGFKNRIINGAMVIDQRNAGNSGTTASVYTVDRWVYYTNLSSKGTWGQNLNSITPPAGFTKYLGFQSNSSYAVASSDYTGFWHSIEGYNVADLGWGTANAATVTLSFWVRSSLTGTFSGSIRNSSHTLSYNYTYTISSANTWEQKSVSVPGPTSGTWETTTNGGIEVLFSMGMGSTYCSTANSWLPSNYGSVTGAVSVYGTNGATFYVTGVQLEKGSTATAFDYRPYGYELQLCQRYYEIIKSVSAIGQASYSTYDGVALGANFRVEKRASPTVTKVSGTQINRTAGGVGTNTGTATDITQYGFSIIMQASSGTGLVQWQNGIYTAETEL